MAYIFRDEDVLDEAFRMKIIREIKSAENMKRKAAMLKRFDMFRDQTLDHVMKRLQDQGFKKETIEQLRARGSNISILKKIIKKKARAYVAGVDRDLPGDQEGTTESRATEAVEEMAELLNVTHVFRRADEYRELLKNCLVYCHPIPTDEVTTPDGARNIWGLTTRILGAHEYDVIPSAADRECAGAVVLSDYPAGLFALSSERGAKGYRDGAEGSTKGDGVDQTIANSPADAGAGGERYIWWTRRYHFTTNGDGKIIPGMQQPDLANLIKTLPFVDLAKDRDGSYWGQGGDDLTEGAILVNVLLTDFAGILSAQGWGQPVLTGNFEKDQPDEVETGPQNLIRLYQKEGQPTPKYELVSTDPNSDAWMRLVEVYIALLLTTNNLSPRNISGKLDASSVASGIAKMIDESESTEDISESQQYYARKEQDFWEIVARWLDVLRPTDRLMPELKAIPPFAGKKVNVRFKQQSTVLSDDEKLGLIEKRKKIGLTMLEDLIKMDDPHLSDQEAKDKLQKILEQRISIQAQDPTLLVEGSKATVTEATQPDPNAQPGQDGGQPANGNSGNSAPPAKNPADKGAAK